MAKGGGKALNAFGSVLQAYFFGYVEGWQRYGALFAILLCGALLIQASDFLENGQNTAMGRNVYLLMVFSFLFTSLLMKMTNAADIAGKFNPADQVAWYLGTKQAPPWHLPALKTLIVLWALSFLGIIYLDSMVTYDRIVRAELSLPVIVANALLIIQLLAPALYRNAEAKEKKG